MGQCYNDVGSTENYHRTPQSYRSFGSVEALHRKLSQEELRKVLAAVRSNFYQALLRRLTRLGINGGVALVFRTANILEIEKTENTSGAECYTGSINDLGTAGIEPIR